MSETPHNEETKPVKVKKQEKYEWHDEGVATLVRLIILGWSAAILTINYLQVPGLAKTNIDPTLCFKRFYWDVSHVRGCYGKI